MRSMYKIGKLLGSLSATILIIPLTIWKSFTIVTLWKWFVIPTFVSAPVLSVPIVFGILLLLGAIKYNPLPFKSDFLDRTLIKTYQSIVGHALYYGFALIIAKIVLLFI